MRGYEKRVAYVLNTVWCIRCVPWFSGHDALTMMTVKLEWKGYIKNIFLFFFTKRQHFFTYFIFYFLFLFVTRSKYFNVQITLSGSLLKNVYVFLSLNVFLLPSCLELFFFLYREARMFNSFNVEFNMEIWYLFVCLIFFSGTEHIENHSSLSFLVDN